MKTLTNAMCSPKRLRSNNSNGPQSNLSAYSATNNE